LPQGGRGMEDDVIDQDELPKPKHEHVLGENLEAISVDELKNRVTALEREITRIRSEIDKKQASKDAASAFFKS
jgi:uncharacterized small protein (DUF1192 family)